MRLFLIRHGETVDNVANVYAGTRDSALTNHGVLQARHLALHLAKHCPADTHIFSSTLQRAVKTAEMLRDTHSGWVVRQLAQLCEKDFGSSEGAKFGARREYPDDAESAESMGNRVDEFLEDHILPLSQFSTGGVVVVAHGIILSVLFRKLCERLSPSALTVSPEAQRSTNPFPHGDILVLPSWSNTGYLEAVLSPSESVAWSTLKLHIVRVNCVDHLQGLRKTSGGIGSARFDEKQRTVDSFFAPKKRKLAGAVE